MAIETSGLIEVAKITVTAFLGGAVPTASAGPMAYVTNEKSDDVSVIDTATNKVVRTIKVGKRPRGVAISTDGRRVYIAILIYLVAIISLFYGFTRAYR